MADYVPHNPICLRLISNADDAFKITRSDDRSTCYDNEPSGGNTVSTASFIDIPYVSGIFQRSSSYDIQTSQDTIVAINQKLKRGLSDIAIVESEKLGLVI